MNLSRWGAERRRKFLAELSATGDVTAAAKAVGYARKHMYELRDEDREFAAAWDKAEANACNAIGAEILRPRIGGGECDVTHGATVMVEEKGHASEIRAYSEALLLAQITAYRPENPREHVGRGAQDDRPLSKAQLIVLLNTTLVPALNRAAIEGKREANVKTLENTQPDGSLK